MIFFGGVQNRVDLKTTLPLGSTTLFNKIFILQKKREIETPTKYLSG